MTTGFLESIVKTIKGAIELSDLPEGFIENILHSRSINEFHYEMFTGWRVNHSEHLLPTKGGVRYSASITREEIEALGQ